MGNDHLRFPRGSTLSNGDINIPTSAGMTSLIPTVTGLITEATPYGVDLASARPVEVLDHDLTNGGTIGASGSITTPGTDQPIKLLAVQASAAVTVSKLGLLVQFSETAKHFGKVVASTYAAADGAPCLPIDNAYPIGTVIAKYDWFFVVCGGPCYIAVGSGKTLTVGLGVASGGSGLADAAAAGNPVVGTAGQTITGDGTVATDYALVYVTGLGASDGA